MQGNVDSESWRPRQDRKRKTWPRLVSQNERRVVFPWVWRKSIELRFEFASLLDSHLSRVNIEEIQINLFPPDGKPILSAPYRAGLKVREFEKHEREILLSEKDFEPAQTELAALIVFPPKKDGLIRFVVDLPHTKHCVQTRCPPDPTHGRIYRLARRGRSLLGDWVEQGYGKVETENEVEERRNLTQITNFIALCGFHLDYEMLQVRSNERSMLLFWQPGGSLHWCSSTILSYSLTLQWSASTILNMHQRFHATQKLPWGETSVTTFPKLFISSGALLAKGV